MSGPEQFPELSPAFVAATKDATVDFVPLSDRPARIPSIHDGPLSLGLVPSPGHAWRACPSCAHVAWRTAPGRNEWQCACPPEPHGRNCHVGEYTFRDCPASPQTLDALADAEIVAMALDQLGLVVLRSMAPSGDGPARWPEDAGRTEPARQAISAAIDWLRAVHLAPASS
jgi:hypothetical protein